MKITNRDKKVLFFKNIFLIMIMAILNVIIYRLFYCGDIFMFPGTLVIIFSFTYWYLLLIGLIIDTYKLTSQKGRKKGLFIDIKFFVHFFIVSLILNVNRYIKTCRPLIQQTLKNRLLSIFIITIIFTISIVIVKNIVPYSSISLLEFILLKVFMVLFLFIFFYNFKIRSFLSKKLFIFTILILLTTIFASKNITFFIVGLTLIVYMIFYYLVYMYIVFLLIIALFKRKEVFHLWKSSHSTLILYQVCDYPPDDIADVVKVNYEDLIAYDTANKAKIKILHIILITILIITLGLIANKLLYLNYRSEHTLFLFEYQVVTATFVILNLLLILFLPHLINYFSYKAELYQQFKGDPSK